MITRPERPQDISAIRRINTEALDTGAEAALVEEGLRRCRAAGYAAVVVPGHPGYYPRIGFVPAGTCGIRSEYDVPAGVFMVKELQDGVLRGCSGTIRYHEVFSTPGSSDGGG